VHIGGSVPAEPASGDGQSIFDEAPLEAVAFAPRAIRPPNRRVPLLAGAWAAGLAAIIGLGVLTGGPAAEAAPDTAIDAVRADDSAGMARSGWPPDPRDLQGVVRLEAPAPALVEITTRRVDVSGTMLVRAERVGIALEARGNRVLDHVWVDVSDRDGGIRPKGTPTFDVLFDLPFPRPNGTMWVVVTAYDVGGLPLGAVRRVFAVGPLLSPGPWAGARPAPPPWCLPASSTLATPC